MPLDYENLSSDQKCELITMGHYFLKALCNAGGAELANEVWTQLAPTVSPVYCSEMMMHFLTDNVEPVVITQMGTTMLKIMKVIHRYTNLTFEETSAIVNNAHWYGRGYIQVHNLLDYRNRDKMIAELRDIGCMVL